MANRPFRESVSRQLLRQSALDHGLAVSGIGYHDTVLQLTDDTGQTEYCIGTLTSRSSSVGNKICLDKQLTIDFIQSLGIKTPETIRHSSLEESLEFLSRHQQIVIKPINSSQSIGVTVGVKTEEDLRNALEAALSPKHPVALLQQQLTGKSYRLFVLDGKFVAAALRRPAQVTGDGTTTLAELVERLNAQPQRSDDHGQPLELVEIEHVRSYVGEQRLNQVIAGGEVVELSPIASMSAGGEAANVTDQVHPDYISITEHIAEKLGLFTCGFDLICEDIAVAPDANFLPVIEVNSKPGLRLHHYPTAGGEPIDLAALLIEALFPGTQKKT